MPLEIPSAGPSPDAGSATPAGPAAAPMSNPTEQEGLKAQARQGLQLAVKLLEASLLPFGTQSPEGKKILSAINSITKLSGESGGPDLQQAEMKMLASKVGPQDAAGPKPPMPGGMPGGMPMGGPQPRPM
jgi:hypothetical protein